MPSPNYSEILATTLHYYSDEIVDNVSNSDAFLYTLKSKGKNKSVSGGDTIVIPLEYQENSTYKRYSGWEELDITPSDVITAANYDWKQVAISVSMSGLELLKNSGKEALFNLMKSKVENAKRTYANNFMTDLQSDGTSDAGKQIGGLQLLLADDPTTGIAGNINRATWTFWRHSKYSCLTDGGAAASVSNIRSNMNALWNSLYNRKQSVDIILADNTFYGYFEASAQAMQMVTESKLAKVGFEAYKYKSADVVNAQGLGTTFPANHMYFINSDFTYLVTHSDRNMVPLAPDRHAVNQDGIIKLMAWAGNLCMSNGRSQGVLIA